MDFKINKLQSLGVEQKGFVLSRPSGSGDYLFLHFITAVDLIVNDQVIHAPKDTCILFSPDFPHKFIANDCKLVHNWIHFKPKDFNIFDSFSISLNQTFCPRNTGFITNMVTTMMLEFINQPPLWEMHINGLMFCLLTMVSRESTLMDHKTASITNQYRAKFDTLRLEIYNHSNYGLDIQSMAKQQGLSRSRFSVLYKSIYGVSPIEDLITARIERTKYLLSISDLPVSSIANEVGYESVEHFIRQFKGKTGFTPSVYRKRTFPVN